MGATRAFSGGGGIFPRQAAITFYYAVRFKPLMIIFTFYLKYSEQMNSLFKYFQFLVSTFTSFSILTFFFAEKFRGSTCLACPLAGVHAREIYRAWDKKG
jgi:hypothetical protein